MYIREKLRVSTKNLESLKVLAGSRPWDGYAQPECYQNRDRLALEEIHIQSGHKIIRYRVISYLRNHQMLNSTSDNDNTHRFFFNLKIHKSRQQNISYAYSSLYNSHIFYSKYTLILIIWGM